MINLFDDPAFDTCRGGPDPVVRAHADRYAAAILAGSTPLPGPDLLRSLRADASPALAARLPVDALSLCNGCDAAPALAGDPSGNCAGCRS